ncbi:MAG: chemotaxis protein CheW [Promethearchaeota archaeon]
MVSLNAKSFLKDKAYLVVKVDSNEFTLSINQIHGIGEFNNEFQEELESGFYLGNFHLHARIIPVINLKKYLNCPNSDFVLTIQSRILFISSTKETILSSKTMIVGLGVDAILGFYRYKTSGKEIKSEGNLSSEANCFRMNSYIEINSKIYPLLNLKKLLDFSQLEKLLEDYLPEKI